jgi:predicted NBD/HSP70 family sugar kinase
LSGRDLILNQSIKEIQAASTGSADNRTDVFTPRLVLIGGGLSAASHHFLPAAWEEVERRVLAVSREGLEIRRGELGNSAGRLGAAWLARDRLG